MSEAASTWVAKLREASDWKLELRAEDLAALMGDVEGLDPKLVEARAQKAALVWLKGRLDAEPGLNQRFGDKTGIGWLDKLLTVARLKELARVKIVKAGKSGGLRYDIGGLGSTWYGRRILDGLGFSRRRTSATREEFAQIEGACARIKLKLPQTVQPTTTERYFAD